MSEAEQQVVDIVKRSGRRGIPAQLVLADLGGGTDISYAMASLVERGTLLLMADRRLLLPWHAVKNGQES